MLSMWQTNAWEKVKLRGVNNGVFYLFISVALWRIHETWFVLFWKHQTEIIRNSVVLTPVWRGMWLGCISAALQDMKITKLALFLKLFFTREHSGVTTVSLSVDVVTVVRIWRSAPKLLCWLPLDWGNFYDCFATSQPNIFFGLSVV